MGRTLSSCPYNMFFCLAEYDSNHSRHPCQRSRPMAVPSRTNVTHANIESRECTLYSAAFGGPRTLEREYMVLGCESQPDQDS